MRTPTARPFWLGTSWKMTKTLAEARSYADRLGAAELPDGLRAFVLPPHTALAAVRDRLGADSRVLVGAQNARPGGDDAITGEVSMLQVLDAGAALIEIGHRDRRVLFGETDDDVAAKAASALACGLIPLVCVGETAEQRARGETEDVVSAQVRAAFSRTDPGTDSEVLVAYEPYWAIGAEGRPAAADEVAVAVDAVRRELQHRLSAAARGVLYGGSVSAGNVRELVTGLDLDGLFVGRAAWSADGLIDLAHHCAAALAERGQEGHERVSAAARKEW